MRILASVRSAVTMAAQQGAVAVGAQIQDLAARATVPDTIPTRSRVEVLPRVLSEGATVEDRIAIRAVGDAETSLDAVGSHRVDAAVRIALADTTATRKEAHAQARHNRVDVGEQGAHASAVTTKGGHVGEKAVREIAAERIAAMSVTAIAILALNVRQHARVE